ncbi:MAG: PilZ domain-containing protein [Magnetococcales bacterium]|nr:PilZ domain-containing protein [Magnetococcales bacterium]
MDYIDFLYQSSPKISENMVGERLEDAVVCSEQKNLTQLLTLMTMEGDFPINVRIGNQIFDYHSFLKLDMISGDVGVTNLYLIIDALDPAIGNIRIRKSDSVMIRMCTKRHNLEFRVNYLELVKRNVLKLSFPEQIIIRTEKRESIRVSVDKSWGFTGSITRKAGITFPVKLINISSGGLFFQPVGELPSIMDGGEIECHFKWKSQNIRCDTQATIIERTSIDEVVYYRCRFIFEQYDSAMRDLEALVATAQLLQIQRRRELFKDFKTPSKTKGDGKAKGDKKKRKKT